MATNSILLGWFGSTEIIVIVLVILLLFGGRKIPELMKGIGRGIREFRTGMTEKDEPEKGENKPS
ncbi:MAG TPA: twin-arginine translocase TatA/TatE family subunit [Bacteroidales bacterium]|jgi:sec-independent protein translocase protein TatA|nr:twin-arginine translocase TatA/TatE family subunit [Lentimicrobiaceae bacterium]HOI00170.1 twin-arginine translocase TatA/TatE family subunit [Bacteroidales bacterium]